MRHTVEEIIAAHRRGKRLKYLFFWGHTERPGAVTKACLSQWYRCTFTVDGAVYHTAEQYMMAQKARLFGDERIYNAIMAAKHPKQYKALGREISGFRDAVWDEWKYKVVVEGNLAKFSQNEALAGFLLSSWKRVLGEASPYDKVWGIGLAADDEKIEDPTKWNGENLLGFALMDVRDQLLEQGC